MCVMALWNFWKQNPFKDLNRIPFQSHITQIEESNNWFISPSVPSEFIETFNWLTSSFFFLLKGKYLYSLKSEVQLNFTTGRKPFHSFRFLLRALYTLRLHLIQNNQTMTYTAKRTQRPINIPQNLSVENCKRRHIECRHGPSYSRTGITNGFESSIYSQRDSALLLNWLFCLK